MTAQTNPDDLLQLSGLRTLGEDPGTEAIRDSLEKFGRLAQDVDELTRQVLRAEAVRIVKRYKVLASAVDAALTPASGDVIDDEDRPGLSLADPEPWPESVDGEDLLADIEGTLRRFIAMDEWAYIAVTLWILHAHAHGSSFVSPVLALLSPEKRCGKTTLLTLIGALVPRPLSTSNITAAALFRSVEKYGPTVLIDEADTFLKDREDLRGIVNSGHIRSSAYVVRTVGDDHEPTTFSTWSPKTIAMIGNPPDTIVDRSVVVKMRRRAPGEQVDRMRLHRLGSLEPLRRKAWRWAQDHDEALRQADPALPGELHDRAADNWRPLLAIADEIGGQWPERARHASVKVAKQADGDDGSVHTLLLGDIRAVFDDTNAAQLATKVILESLHEMEGRPWGEWGRSNKPMTPHALGRALKRFDVSPHQFRDGLDVVRGYARTDLDDAFRRYLHLEGGGAKRDNGDNGSTTRESGGFESVTESPGVTDSKTPVCGSTPRMSHLSRFERGEQGEKVGLQPDLTGLTENEIPADEDERVIVEPPRGSSRGTDATPVPSVRTDPRRGKGVAL